MSLTSLCTETAVYWAPGAPDGYGKRTFAAPVEIKCRWQDQIIRAVDDVGVEFVSRAVVYPLQDLEGWGRLYRGTLASLSGETDPAEVVGAFCIRSRARSQNPSGSIVVRKIILGEG